MSPVVPQSIHEKPDYHPTIQASDIGLRPGEWPAEIVLRLSHWFYDERGDLVCAEYRLPNGVLLHVEND